LRKNVVCPLLASLYSCGVFPDVQIARNDYPVLLFRERAHPSFIGRIGSKPVFEMGRPDDQARLRQSSFSQASAEDVVGKKNLTPLSERIFKFHSVTHLFSLNLVPTEPTTSMDDWLSRYARLGLAGTPDWQPWVTKVCARINNDLFLFS